MFGIGSKSRIERLEGELSAARAAAVKAAGALEAARDATISAVAGGEAKSVATARTKEAAARGASEAATSAVDDIATALGKVREEEAAFAADAEIAATMERLESSRASGEAALAEGARKVAEGLLLVGRAFVEIGDASEASALLRKRGVIGPQVSGLHTHTAEEAIAKALDAAYPNVKPPAPWREEIEIDLRPYQCIA